MPKGIIKFSERWVESVPITFQGTYTLVLYGANSIRLLSLMTEIRRYRFQDIRNKRASYPPLRSTTARLRLCFGECCERPVFLPPCPANLVLLVFEPDLFVATQMVLRPLMGNLPGLKFNGRTNILRVHIKRVIHPRTTSPPLSQGTCEWCGYRNPSTGSNRSEADLRNCFNNLLISHTQMMIQWSPPLSFRTSSLPLSYLIASFCTVNGLVCPDPQTILSQNVAFRGQSGDRLHSRKIPDFEFRISRVKTTHPGYKKTLHLPKPTFFFSTRELVCLP